MKYYGKITDPKDWVTKEYADAKYTKPSTGIPASDLASDVIPSAYTSNPAMNGTANAGVSASWAKGDHVHPTDTTRQAKINASGILKGDGAGNVSAAAAGTDYATPAQVNAKYTKPSTGIPDSDSASAATWNGKAASSTALSLTLASGSWSSATPSTQTVTATGVTSSNHIIVGIASTITSAQYDAVATAKLVCTAQGTNSITVTAFGDTPTENIPISVVILG